MSATFDQAMGKDKNKKSTSVSAKSVLEGRKNVKRMTIEVPTDLHTSLRQASVDKGEYIRDIVVKACKQYLREEGYDIKL